MTPKLSVEYEAQLLNRLRQAVAERAQREGEVCRNYDAQIARIQQEFADELQELTSRYEQQREALQREYQAVREQIEQQYQTDSAQTQAEYDQVLSEIQQTYDERIETARRKHDEALWMVDSYFDEDADDSPKHQYDLLKLQVEKTKEHFRAEWQAIQEELDESRELMRRWRQWRDFVRPSPQLKVSEPGEAQEQFDQCVARARQTIQNLHRLVVPRLFAGWTPFLWFAAVFVLLGTAGALLLDPKSLNVPLAESSPEWYGTCAGAACAVTLLVQLILLSFARGRSGRVYHQLLQCVVDAQAAMRHWQEHMKKELKRLAADAAHWDVEVQRRRDENRRKVQERYEKELQEAEQQRAESLQHAHEYYPNRLREIAQRREQALQEADEKYPRQIRELDQWFETEKQSWQSRLEAALSNHESGFGREWNDLAIRWRTAIDETLRAADQLNEISRRFFRDWDTLAQSWTPPRELPPGIRIGQFEVDLEQMENGLPPDERLRPDRTRFTLPAILPFPHNATTVIRVDGQGKSEGVRLLQTAMLRFLTTLPPGQIRFTIIDPVGLGENLSAFMHLADFDELLISNRIWTESSHIEKRLADLTEHMENIFQAYLRNEFKTILEYNEQAGEVAEPFHVLVVANFPVNFTEAAARRLVSIAHSGPRCGIFTLVSVDTSQPFPHRFDLNDLEREATRLVWKKDRFVWDSPEFKDLPLQLDEPPEPEQFVRIVRKVGEESKDARRVEVPFEVIAPPPSRLWTCSSRDGLDVPLGRAGATKLQYMRLGRGTSQHVLVAGKTGSGKSSFLHALITNTALHYSPDEFEFYLIDFKKGVEFKTYATHRLPHCRAIAIESDREFGLSVLHRLNAVLKERGDLFRQHGVQDLPSFRRSHPDVRMPRILLIVDEFHEFFVEDDKIAQDAALLLDRLVRQGRAFGIHVLLGSQTLAGAYTLARSTLGQMAVRIALQCSEADAHLILSEENAAARLLSRPGEAIYNDANGLVEGNHPFQVAWLPEDKRNRYLEQIRELAEQRGVKTEPPIVFEGNVPADPRRNETLVQLLRRPRWEETVLAPTAWLGDPVEIKEPTNIQLRRQSGANVLVVGQDEPGALGVLSSVLLSVAAQTRPIPNPSTAQFYLFNGSMDDSEHSELWIRLAQILPHRIQVVEPRRVKDAMQELATELARREEQSNLDAPPIFVFVHNLGRFRELRKEEDDFGFSFDKDKPADPAQQFLDILRKGPALGIYTVVWCDSYGNVTRWMSSQTLRDFETRIVFHLSATDSSHLIDSTAAARLGKNRALLCLMDRGDTEKFRPYAPPSDEWLNFVAQCFENEARKLRTAAPQGDEAAAAIPEQSAQPDQAAAPGPAIPTETPSVKSEAAGEVNGQAPPELSPQTTSTESTSALEPRADGKDGAEQVSEPIREEQTEATSDSGSELPTTDAAPPSKPSTSDGRDRSSTQTAKTRSSDEDEADTGQYWDVNDIDAWKIL